MKKIRKVLLFTLLATAMNAVAQTGYQSFLSSDTTQWYIEQDALYEERVNSYEFTATDSFYIDGVFCRKLTCSYVFLSGNRSFSYIPYPTNTRNYLSEDTVAGKLWLYMIDVNDTTNVTKKLMVDMSLEVGDTFCLPLFVGNNYVDSIVYTVDSVLYLGGKKHIFMSDKSIREYELKINLFVEGIGCSNLMFYPIGYRGFSDWFYELGFLRCCYKNGLSVYRDTLIWYMNDYEDCVQSYISLHEPEPTPRITAYPNPTKDRITFDFGGAQFEKLQVINTAGVVVREARLGGQTQYSLPLKGLPSGIYSCILSGKDGTATEKIVVE